MTIEHSGDSDLDASTTTWMTWWVVLLVVFIAAFPAYRAIEPGRRAAAREQSDIHLATQGAELYEVSCAQCHGIEAQGGVAPAFNSKEFLFSASDPQVAQLIAVGVPGSQMSAYSNAFGGPFTSEQIESVVVYIRSLEEDAPDFPEWRFPLSQTDLTGSELFTLGCASCHGYQLEGTEDIPALGPGSDAAEESDSRLLRRIRDGKDEMPAFGGTLNEDQIDLVISYLRDEQQG